MFSMRQNISVLPTFVDDPGVSPRSCKVTQPPPWLLSPLALKQEDFFYSVWHQKLRIMSISINLTCWHRWSLCCCSASLAKARPRSQCTPPVGGNFSVCPTKQTEPKEIYIQIQEMAKTHQKRQSLMKLQNMVLTLSFVSGSNPKIATGTWWEKKKQYGFKFFCRHFRKPVWHSQWSTPPGPQASPAQQGWGEELVRCGCSAYSPPYPRSL